MMELIIKTATAESKMGSQRVTIETISPPLFKLKLFINPLTENKKNEV